MRRCLWGVTVLMLGGGIASAQNVPPTQPAPMPPFPTSPLPTHPPSMISPQLPSLASPLPSLTPLTAPTAPAPTVAPAGMPAGVTAAPEARDSAGAPQAENLVSFDNLRADLSWAGNHWVLKSGNVVLKDFGQREFEAHQALRLVRELHLTQHGTVGGPNPVMEYWLSNGRAPQGLATGLRQIPLDAKNLRVEQEQGQWVLRDAHRVLFNFGQGESDARQSLGIIQKYGFTQIAVLGQAAPLMLVFLAPPADPLAPRPVPSGQHLTPQAHPSNDAIGGPALPASGGPTNTPGTAGTLVSPAVMPLRQPTLQPQGPHYPFGGTQPHDVIPAQHTAVLGPEAVLPGLTELGNKVPFDWRQVKLAQEGTRWKMKVGDHQLADFGTDQVSAQRALAAVHYYHFNEQCLVGGPQPCFSYFLVSGKAPQGTTPAGAQTQSFRPESLAVKQVGQRWAVVANDQPLVQLRDKPEEAKQLLEAIQRNRFDRLCRLGPDEDHALTFFVRSR